MEEKDKEEKKQNDDDFKTGCMFLFMIFMGGCIIMFFMCIPMILEKLF